MFKKIIFSGFLLMFLSIIPQEYIVQAATDATAILPKASQLVPQSTDLGYFSELLQYTDVRDAAITITNYILGFLGILAVLIVIYAGFKLVISQDDSGIKDSGNIIKNVILGIIVIFLAYAIVNFAVSVANRGPAVDSQGRQQIAEYRDANGDPYYCLKNGQPQVDPRQCLPMPTSTDKPFDRLSDAEKAELAAQFAGQVNPNGMSATDPTVKPLLENFSGQVSPSVLQDCTIDVQNQELVCPPINPSNPDIGDFAGQVDPELFARCTYDEASGVLKCPIDTSKAPNLEDFAGQIDPNDRTSTNPNTAPSQGDFGGQTDPNTRTNTRTNTNPNTAPDEANFASQILPGGLTPPLPTMPTTNIPGLPSPPTSNNVTSLNAQGLPLTAPLPGYPTLPGVPGLPSANFIDPRALVSATSTDPSGITSIQDTVTEIIPVTSQEPLPVRGSRNISEAEFNRVIGSQSVESLRNTIVTNQTQTTQLLSGVGQKLDTLSNTMQTLPLSIDDVNNNVGKLSNEVDQLKTTLPKTDQIAGLISASERNIKSFLENPTPETFAKLKASINDLGKSVASMPKIEVKLGATPVNGEAPLTTFFTLTDSKDPTLTSIIDSKITWSYVNQAGEKQTFPGGVFAKYTFDEPGSYVVNVKVESLNKDSNAGVLDGVASIQVNVLPKNIDLKIRVNSTDVIPGDTLRFNLSESSDTKKTDPQDDTKTGQGLMFDPSLSMTTPGAVFTNFIWSFGDGSARRSFDGNPRLFTYPFRKEGLYPVSVTATDSLKRVKTLNFNIEVSKILPDFDVTPFTGTVNTKFTFDSSRSKSERTIITRNWEIFDDTGKSIKKLSGSKAEFQAPKPGSYIVRLTVEDDTKNANSDQKEITVISENPKTTLEVTKNTYGPEGSFILDASKSFDPDGEKVKYNFYIDNNLVTLKSLDGSDRTIEQPIGIYQADKAGSYKAEVVAEDEFGNTSKFVKEFKVDPFFDGEIKITPKVSNINEDMLFEVSGIDITFVLFDFGDGKTERNSKLEAIHTYTKPGIYDAKFTIYQAVENSKEKELLVTRKVYIGDGQSPIPVPVYTVDGFGRELVTDVCQGAPGLLMTRTEELKADASDSINLDGSNRFLEYIWDFGDGTLLNTENASHRFSVASELCYKVFLRVTDAETKKSSISTPLFVKVVNNPPVLDDIRVSLDNNDFPSLITVKAVGAKDFDGSIKEYVWTYRNFGSVDPLKVISTKDPEVVFNIAENDLGQGRYDFEFDVNLVDDEGLITNSKSYLGRAEVLSIDVKERVYPDVSILASKKKVLTGDRVELEVVPKVNGEIVNGSKTDWDYNGDGYYEDRDITTPKITHVFDKAGVYDVVANVKYAGTNVKQSITIQVLPSKVEPKASFIYTKYGSMVIFQDTSVGDDLASRVWDTDMSIDTDGDGNPSNDIDSTLKDFSKEYVEGQEYSVSLTVENSDGKKSTITRRVSLFTQQGTPSVIPVELKPDPSKDLQAITLTNPTMQKDENGLYLELTPLRPEVTFIATTSRGSISKYVYDFDLDLDTNGDGILDNDEDNLGTTSYTTGEGLRISFSPSKGPKKARLTVYENDSQNTDNLDFEIRFSSLSEALSGMDQQLFEVSNIGGEDSNSGTGDILTTGAPKLESSESDIDFLISQVQYMTKGLTPKERLEINKSLLNIKFEKVNDKELGQEFLTLSENIKNSNLDDGRKESVDRILSLLEMGVVQKDPEAIDRAVGLSVQLNNLEENSNLVEGETPFVVDESSKEPVVDNSTEIATSTDQGGFLSSLANSRIWSVFMFIWAFLRWFLYIVVTITIIILSWFGIHKYIVNKDGELTFEDWYISMKDKFNDLFNKDTDYIEMGVPKAEETVEKSHTDVIDIQPTESNDTANESPKTPSWLKIDDNIPTVAPTEENISSSVNTEETVTTDESVSDSSSTTENNEVGNSSEEILQEEQVIPEAPVVAKDQAFTEPEAQTDDVSQDTTTAVDPWAMPVVNSNNNTGEVLSTTAEAESTIEPQHYNLPVEESIPVVTNDTSVVENTEPASPTDDISQSLDDMDKSFQDAYKPIEEPQEVSIGDSKVGNNVSSNSSSDTPKKKQRKRRGRKPKPTSEQSNTSVNKEDQIAKDGTPDQPKAQKSDDKKPSQPTNPFDIDIFGGQN